MPSCSTIPVVERTVIFEFERADGVRDAFNRIRLAVRKVVHRVNAPIIAGAVMLGVQNAIHHRIAHIQIRRRHIDLCAKSARAVREIAAPHALQQIQIFFHRPVAIRALLTRFGQRAAILPHLVSGEIADISLPRAHQLLRPRIKLREIIGREKRHGLPNRTPASARCL